MRAGIIAVFWVSAATVGCMTAPPSHPVAFTEEWAAQYERYQANKPIKQEEVVLVGKGKGARAFVYTDEKGKPRVAVGATRRLSADVDIKHGQPSVKVKYKLKFGPKRRRFPVPEPVQPSSQENHSEAAQASGSAPPPSVP